MKQGEQWLNKYVQVSKKNFFWPYHNAYGILVPRPEIEPALPVMEVRSLNHWIFDQ